MDLPAFGKRFYLGSGQSEAPRRALGPDGKEGYCTQAPNMVQISQPV
jgi:hypothetical protein